jgi:hypothetical protein
MLNVLQEDTALFTIPDKILLSACNSGLRNLVADEDWDVLEENGGWASLMLSMMWEEAQGEASRWSGYISMSSMVESNRLHQDINQWAHVYSGFAEYVSNAHVLDGRTDSGTERDRHRRQDRPTVCRRYI